MTLVAHQGWIETSVTQAHSIKIAALFGYRCLGCDNRAGPLARATLAQHSRGRLPLGLIHLTAIHRPMPGTAMGTAEGIQQIKPPALPKGEPDKTQDK